MARTYVAAVDGRHITIEERGSKRGVRTEGHHMTRDILAVAGVALVVLGIVRRRRRWGAVALGVVALAVSLFVFGGASEMARGDRDGFRAGSGGR